MDTWISAHLFYYPPFDTFLAKGVQSIVASAKKKFEIEKVFFIRYWEQGPHIRLRIKLKNSYDKEALKAFLIQKSKLYFKKYPCIIPDKTELPVEWYPIHSCQFIAYEPETERYGGEKAIAIAESHFNSSTASVFSLLKNTKDWNYDSAMLNAIMMHVSFIASMGLSKEECIDFFNFFYKSWLDSSIKNIRGNFTDEVTEEERKEAENTYQATFLQQRQQLVYLCTMVWDTCRAGDTFGIKWLDTWAKENKNIHGQYQAIAKEILPFHLPRLAHDTNNWAIYNSLVHMTNNRLGIINRDESFIAYAIKMALA